MPCLNLVALHSRCASIALTECAPKTPVVDPLCVLLQLSRLVLSPHIYPTTVTGAVDEMEAALQTITYRWDQSWGWKMQGIDTTVQVGPVRHSHQLVEAHRRAPC